MTQPVSILLPGLDGTGDVFGRFVAAAPAELPVRVQRLPSERPRSYVELVDALLSLLPLEPFALIAESFSGPLAVLIASRCPRVRAVVLCATFVRAPLPRALAHLPEFFWKRPPPQSVLQLFMTGGDRRLAADVREAVATVDGAILHSRVEAILNVDVTAELESLTQPLLYIRAERDRLIPARCADVIRRAKPSARVATVDGPHLILQARPEASWRQIAPFLAQAFLRPA